MCYIISIDVLMNCQSILKNLESMTIITSDMQKIYAMAEDKYRDSINKIRAERAIKIVSSCYKKIFFAPQKDITAFLKDCLDDGCKDSYTIITNNVVLWSIADTYHIEVQKYETTSDYTGIQYLTLTFDENGYNEELDELLSTTKFDDVESPFCENEYLIVYDIDKPNTPHSMYRMQDGRLHPISLNPQSIKNSYDTIKPKNAEQIALFNALFDKNISILLTVGQFGTGKSFCLHNYALEALENGDISRIIYVPNNSFNENTREVGTLPGELFDKELIHLGCWLDLIGYDRLRRYVEEEKIQIVPVSIARGRSFNDAIILVNEAQNLTDKHVKLLVGRCGQNSRIFFDGDVKQADNDTFRDRSGLQLLTKLRKSKIFSRIFSMVKLNNIEGSLTAQSSAYLDVVE